MDPPILRERAYIRERDQQHGMLQNEDIENKKLEWKMSHLLSPQLAKDAKSVEPRTIFHGDEKVDYRGRSWMPPPSSRGAESFDVDDHHCYVPKKCVAASRGMRGGCTVYPRM